METQLPLLERGVILRAELENYTPLLAGGWETDVTTKIGVNPVPAAASLSKQLIGRTRWFLRALISTAHGLKSQKAAEAWPSYRLALGRNKQYSLGLVQLLFGSSDPPWRALYTVHFTMVDPDQCVPDDTFVERSGRIVNRYKLLTLNLDLEGKRRKAPLRPGCRFRLIIRRRLPLTSLSGILSVPEGAPDPSTFDDIVSSTVLAVLRLVGIGQGATRGFGRFKIISHKTSIDNNILLNKIVKNIEILDSVVAGNRKDIQRARNAIRGILQQLLVSTLGNGKPRGGGIGVLLWGVRVYDPTRNLQFLAKLYRKLPRMKNAKLYDYENQYLALEIIGIATLKAAWKFVNNEIRRGGGAYHTWILGLPRRQKVASPVPCEEDSGNQGSTHEGDLPTGYILREPGSDKSLSILSRAKEYMIATTGPLSGGLEEFSYIEGRRASPIHLMPVNDRSPLIALIPYSPDDMRSITGRLYHSGGLIYRWANEPRFLDRVRVAGVETIARRGVPRVCECNREYVNDCVAGVTRPGIASGRCECGSKDPIGRRVVARPLEEQRDLVTEAYGAALAFLDCLLGRSCGGGSP